MTYKMTDKKVAKVAKVADEIHPIDNKIIINKSPLKKYDDNEKILTNTYKSDFLSPFSKKYGCKNCNYYTNKKFDYNKHLNTDKHINKTSNLSYSSKSTIISNPTIENKFNCVCGKYYKHRQSLYNHQKNCNFNKNNEKNENNENNENNEKNNDIIESKEEEINYKECFYFLMNQIKSQGEQNALFQTTLLELIPKIKNEKEIVNCNNQIQNITNNNINQNFNISIFLNENCKDAMNIGDFVKNIEVSVKDLFVSKEKGIIDGVSNIFINHLKQIPLVQRPLWCSDKKKKRLFIKDDCWREDINNEKTNEAIYNISKIQTKSINKYIDDKPNWIKNENVKDNYMAIVKKTTEPIDNKKNKIIDKLLDTIYLTENDAKNIKQCETKKN